MFGSDKHPSSRVATSLLAATISGLTSTCGVRLSPGARSTIARNPSRLRAVRRWIRSKRWRTSRSEEMRASLMARSGFATRLAEADGAGR